MSLVTPLVSHLLPNHVTPKIQDFKVQIHESTILPPNDQDHERKKCFFLSNLDQAFNFPISTVHFFSANPDFPIATVLERFKTAMQRVLVPYDFLAGRLRHNHQSGRLEIECNGAGAGFVVASSQFSLDEMIGELAYPNPGYRQLVVQTLDNFGPNCNDQPLCIIQVTSFKCGGFSFGFTWNHLCYDANGARVFLDNLASQAFEDKRPLAVVPCHDRHLLEARSPPRVEFPHPELIIPPPSTDQSNNSTIDFPVQEEEVLVPKIFKLSSNQIDYLKDKAKRPSTGTTGTKPIKITRFSVVAALIWRCKALSTMDDHLAENDSVCTLNIAVDIRQKLNPPLPTSYCGNAIIYAHASSKCIELEKKPFPEIVRVLSDGVIGLTDEYISSTLDWYEINKLGKPKGDYFMSSWWRVGFEQVVYPWGKPVYCSPIRTQKVCFLFPSCNDREDTGAVNVILSLPAKKMDKFQSLFYEFLKN